MLATITCPVCQHKFSIPEGAMGKRHNCPSCHSPFLAGKSVAAAAAPMKLQPAAAAPTNKTMLGEIEPPIKYNCPRCKSKLEAPAIEAGTKKPCPGCGQRVQVPVAGVETPSTVQPAAKPSMNWLMVAGAGGAVLLLGAFGLGAGGLFLLNKQPDKKGNEELSKPSADLAAPKDDDQKKRDDAKDGDTKVEAKENRLKTTIDGIEFELVSAKIKRGNFEVVISVMTPDAGKSLHIPRARAFTEEGKVFTKSFGKGRTKLPMDQKIQFKLEFDPLPDTVSKLSSIEISGDLSGDRSNQMTIGFKNVTVERYLPDVATPVKSKK